MKYLLKFIYFITNSFRATRKDELLTLTWKSSGQIAEFLSMPIAKAEAVLRNLAQNNLIRFIGNAEVEGVHIGLRYALEDVMQVLKETSVPPKRTTIRQVTAPKPATQQEK